MINLKRAAFNKLVANCYADKEADDISREGKGIIYAHERIEELEKALINARENIEEWSSYASDYFTEKNGLADDLAAIDKVLGGDT